MRIRPKRPWGFCLVLLGASPHEKSSYPKPTELKEPQVGTPKAALPELPAT